MVAGVLTWLESFGIEPGFRIDCVDDFLADAMRHFPMGFDHDALEFEAFRRRGGVYLGFSRFDDSHLP